MFTIHLVTQPSSGASSRAPGYMDRRSSPAPTASRTIWTKPIHASSDPGKTQTSANASAAATAVGPKNSHHPAWRSVPRCRRRNALSPQHGSMKIS